MDMKNQQKSVSTSSLTTKSEDSDGRSEKSKRKKKIVVEIKGDASSDDGQLEQFQLLYYNHISIYNP